MTELTTQSQNQIMGAQAGAPQVPATTPGHITQVEQTRAAQEVQAAMTVAKRFPRDENISFSKIMRSCERATLAQSAIYSYPRGGSLVKGPSIHLAKAIAKAWGNLDFGIRELSQTEGESVVESFCWDLETNTRETKIFTVPHERHTRNGVKSLKDPRDIYELIANNGSRRLRACILGIIPQDIVDAAVERCYKTLQKGSGDKPLADRVREMTAYFSSVGITEKLLEKRLGHNLSTVDETELLDLRMIANSLKTGEAKREDFFDLGTGEGGFADDLNTEFETTKSSKTQKTQETTKEKVQKTK